ncbi:major facilitator superfamily domain-containing protein [Aspergillus avenaceus]|uniref:Major facilitator superfamily domain-containing protein n=1 Tax=Aspergillus avenaceus TaxID=36643 RepID=A0A5N6TKU5_ASPAV|nr:major facilitator superfamily domain-containing protein [Aspergillus avenaceus]
MTTEQTITITPNRPSTDESPSSESKEKPSTGDELEGQEPELKPPANSALVIFCISCITFISCYLGGLVTVSVPTIARDLHLNPGVELWPVSMYALATGCTLLISGAISDAVGSRPIFLIGCFLQSIFSMACGVAATGLQLILFRIISGIATSLCLPSAMSLISENFPAGKLRNLAFAFMGGGQPIGFGVGVLFGGIFTDTVGWRWGFHSAAIANTLAFLLSWTQLPRRHKTVSWHMLGYGIDWIGAIAASTALGLLSYALSLITGDVRKIHDVITIVFFSLSGALLIFFVIWQGWQERRSKPTLIRNSLWKNTAFSCICVNVFMIWGAFNAFEQVINFFFQNVQHLTGLDTALRFIPTPITGLLSSLVTGLVLHRCRADAIINITTVISAVSPLIMALVNPDWPYWRCAFVAICLNSIAADSLFTVSNILIAGVFPADTQGLAAGVFNTVSQIGKSVGLALVALISNQVTHQQSSAEDRSSPEALMKGYRAAFWTLFGMNVASLAVSTIGLRKVGNIGRKKTQ